MYVYACVCVCVGGGGAGGGGCGGGVECSLHEDSLQTGRLMEKKAEGGVFPIPFLLRRMPRPRILQSTVLGQAKEIAGFTACEESTTWANSNPLYR